MTRYVQLVANPINWALSAGSLFIAPVLVVAGGLARRAELRSRARQLAPIVATAMAFYLGHGLLGAHRVMYLYHDFLPELLGVLCLPFLLRDLMLRAPQWRGRLEVASWGVIVASAAAFLWFAPLVYHRPLTHQSCEMRNVPAPVVACRD